MKTNNSLICQALCLSPISPFLKAVQVAQNKIMRLLSNASFKDQTSTKELLEKTGFLSVNQTAASFILTEVWKGLNIVNYPINLEPNNSEINESLRVLRPSTVRNWNQDARSTAAKESFSRNAAKLWNSAPQIIKDSKSIYCAKIEIKKYCKSLPI